MRDVTEWRLLTILVDILTSFLRRLETLLTIHKFPAMGIWKKVSAKFKSCTTAPPYPTGDRFSPVEGGVPITLESENPENLEGGIRNTELETL